MVNNKNSGSFHNFWDWQTHLKGSGLAICNFIVNNTAPLLTLLISPNLYPYLVTKTPSLQCPPPVQLPPPLQFKIFISSNLKGLSSPWRELTFLTHLFEILPNSPDSGQLSPDTTLHYTTLHHTTLHYTTLHYSTLHHTTLLSPTDQPGHQPCSKSQTCQLAQPWLALHRNLKPLWCTLWNCHKG